MKIVTDVLSFLLKICFYRSQAIRLGYLIPLCVCQTQSQNKSIQKDIKKLHLIWVYDVPTNISIAFQQNSPAINQHLIGIGSTLISSSFPKKVNWNNAVIVYVAEYESLSRGHVLKAKYECLIVCTTEVLSQHSGCVFSKFCTSAFDLIF